MNVLVAFGITSVIIILVSYFGIFIPEMLSSDNSNMVLFGIAGIAFPLIFVSATLVRYIKEKME